MAELSVSIKQEEKAYPVIIKNLEISDLCEKIFTFMEGKNYIAVISQKVEKLFGEKFNIPKQNKFILKDGEREKNFKKLITKDDLQESIIYLNLSDVDQEQFIDTFNSTYPYKNSLEKHYPALVSFEDGEIEGILQGSSNHELTISQTEQFIDMHQIKKQGEQ